MHGSRKFFQRGSNVDSIFSYGDILIPLKADHHLHASETPFKWQFAGMPIIVQHLMLVCDFSGDPDQY